VTITNIAWYSSRPSRSALLIDSEIYRKPSNPSQINSSTNQTSYEQQASDGCVGDPKVSEPVPTETSGCLLLWERGSRTNPRIYSSEVRERSCHDSSWEFDARQECERFQSSSLCEHSSLKCTRRTSTRGPSFKFTIPLGRRFGNSTTLFSPRVAWEVGSRRPASHVPSSQSGRRPITRSPTIIIQTS
jgi:hypothetical protein